MTRRNASRIEVKYFGSRSWPTTVYVCFNFIQHSVVYECELPFVSLLWSLTFGNPVCCECVVWFEYSVRAGVNRENPRWN
jgi:hypothetical protein